jgi:hypothetical protein
MARFHLLFAIAALFAGPLVEQTRAGTETREYVVLVNGKEAGQSTIVIVDADDGKTYMKGTVSVKIPGIVFPYSFASETQEWWLRDRLTNLVAVTTENGKKTEVAAKAEVDRVLVSVKGQSRAVSWEVWTSSFWRLADRRFHNKDVPVLEPDTGKDMLARLEYIGSERLKVGAQIEECFRFRVTGIPSTTDVWFDKHHRMVRQEFTESNQRMIVQLMSRRN